ncbi:MAG TPA: branched-chain amino acid ABC transporter permease [Casimicrobiaceae bacterium]|jgi:branched-chain amino acid transport system permease protein
MTELSLLFEAPALAVQLLIDGLLVGALFALIAYGMALVWGVMNVINIAQGELVMLGGYVVLYLVRAGVPVWAGVPAAALALYVVGWLLYRIVIFRVVDKDLFISILATFGLSILIQQIANQWFGADVQSVPSSLGSFFFAGGMITIAKIKLIAFALAVAIGASLVVFLKRSRLGRAIRATAQNARAARIVGIDTHHVYAQAFALNAAICGAAGGLVAMTWVIHPYLGLTYTIRSFMIVIVAGLGNIASVLLAGAGLGVAENFAGFLLGTEYQTAFVFALLVVILVARNLTLARRRSYLR